jgi:prohibitin 1
MKKVALSLALFCHLLSCTVVRPGEVALKQKLGKLAPNELAQGPHSFNPFVTQIFKINVQTVELIQPIALPTKEGLNVDAKIALLYHVRPEKARDVYTQYGINYERVIVETYFLATVREVTSLYEAKDLHAVKRKEVEDQIKIELKKNLSDKGFEVDAVLLKDVIMPAPIAQAIKNKVSAEQAALEMDFVIERQKKEAERMRIEAEGIKAAQQIISSSLSKEQLQYNSIEMMKGLITSPNTKVIITDGKTPTILDTQK